MSLSPGEAWGDIGFLPADAPIAASDADLIAIIGPDVGIRTADELPIIGLAGGDLCASLGGRGNVHERRGAQATVATIDVGIASTDTGSYMFAAHLFARGRLWSGEGLAVMNAERRQDWLVAPRAHPGDGILDVVRGRLSPRDRALARRRLRTGEHVPHPHLMVRRATHLEVDFDRPRRLIVDGIASGTTRSVSVRVVPRALRVAI